MQTADLAGPGMNTRYRNGCLWGLTLLLLAAMPAAWCADEEARLQEQRREFLQAQRALRTGDIRSFKRLLADLSDYPLYAYLLYDVLRARLPTASPEEVSSFLVRFGDLPRAEDLRSEWLRTLARRGRWQAFLTFYAPQTDTTLQCYQLLARIRTGSRAYLLEDARTLWLSPRSQPSQCDEAFEMLYASDLMTHELVWSRIRLAMDEGETGLARNLASRLPAGDQRWVGRWIAIYQNPARGTLDPGLEDTEIARAALLQAMRRLVKMDGNLAITRWPALRSSYGFAAAEQAEIDRLLALGAAKNNHPEAKDLLGAVHSVGIDEELFDWRLRVALKTRDWRTLLGWTEGEVPDKDPVRQSWLYWRARALEQTGNAEDASAIFHQLATERDYYAFLAADRMGIAYDLNHHPLPEDLGEWERLARMPAVQRARELYVLEMTTAAAREWQHALEGMTTYQMQIAAMIASNWGWHHRAILTMVKARSLDDLVLRFPVPYEKQLREYADLRNLDLAWVYAVTRAESAFLEDARSPAGALGLMQVMPQTGRDTARSIGLRKFSTPQLLDSGTNIPIGTAYLRQMLNRFNDNVVLATAAYNAGPGNVSNWISAQDCIEPDIWIERIPFTETRKYVQRILYYSSIYDWRLGQEVVPLRVRMAAVSPRDPNLVAGLGCTGGVVSMH
ncbi:MAG: transglycosylase SLT domain-containing protein [Gammaproteobacteria bacterium]|nr:transglycosylase SLT domain-containing protein [Gammaproteobacteria bacterium]